MFSYLVPVEFSCAITKLVRTFACNSRLRALLARGRRNWRSLIWEFRFPSPFWLLARSSALQHTKVRKNILMVILQDGWFRRTQPFEFPKAQQHLGLHGRPTGKSLRPAGLRATFLYEPLGFVFVLKNFFGCDWVTPSQCHLRITAIAGSELQQLPFQLSLRWKFLFPGLLYPEAESGLNHLSSIRYVASPLLSLPRFR